MKPICNFSICFDSDLDLKWRSEMRVLEQKARVLDAFSSTEIFIVKELGFGT